MGLPVAKADIVVQALSGARAHARGYGFVARFARCPQMSDVVEVELHLRHGAYDVGLDSAIQKSQQTACGGVQAC